MVILLVESYFRLGAVTIYTILSPKRANFPSQADLPLFSFFPFTSPQHYLSMVARPHLAESFYASGTNAHCFLRDDSEGVNLLTIALFASMPYDNLVHALFAIPAQEQHFDIPTTTMLHLMGRSRSDDMCRTCVATSDHTGNWLNEICRPKATATFATGAKISKR